MGRALWLRASLEQPLLSVLVLDIIIKREELVYGFIKAGKAAPKAVDEPIVD